MAKDMSGANNPAYTHGHTTGKFSPEYHSWASMIQRCTNPARNTYKYYGGKGIKVCPEWFSFQRFLDDMGHRPAGTSLERLDYDKDYTPSNCCWADAKTQARNSSQAVWVEISGVQKRLVEWCEELGISINTVRDRVKFYGMSYTEALTIGKQRRPGVKLRQPKREIGNV